MQALEHLVAPATRGDPESPLLWTSKSTTKLANELCKNGHKVSQRTVWELLDQLGYSMQSNRKTLEGSDNPDRDAQFKHINRKVAHFQKDSIPVISVDTKKKELVGRFKNNGREWQPLTENWRGRPLESTATVVSLISGTTTAQGLKINAALDETYYVAGIKISDEVMEGIAITRDKFHGEWNYRINPKIE